MKRLKKSFHYVSETSVQSPSETTNPGPATTQLRSANVHIFRALLSLASANLLIRIAGLLNQVIVTAHFGQTATMDAYFIATSVPVLLAPLFAGAIESSVIPVYTQLRAYGSREEASRLFSTLFNILLVGLVLFTLVLLILRQPIVTFSAPGLHNTAAQRLAIALAPLTFPVLLFMIMNSFLECFLNVEGQFGWPAYVGMLVPLTTVSFVLLGGSSYGVLMLCLGTLIGQILQLGGIAFRARRAHLAYHFVLDIRSKELAAIGMVAWPSLTGALIAQAAPFVDQIFGSYLSPGSIAVINNANKLISVPVGVIFASVGRAALPYLASQAALRDMRSFKDTLRLYLWGIAIGTLLLTLFLLTLAHPIVSLLFQHGAFTAEDTNRTALTSIGFAPGLIPMALGFFMSRAFVALGKMRTLVLTTACNVIMNAIFDYLLGRLWGSFGIALATSAVYCCTMFLLFFLLHREIGPLNLLTPPRQMSEALLHLGLERYYARWRMWEEKMLTITRIPARVAWQALRLLFVIAVFGTGIAGTLSNAQYALRVAFGSILLLTLLRYRYALLLTWIAIDALIGSTLPFFSGNNFLSGLTIPTLLLLVAVPIKSALHRMPALTLLFVNLLWMLLSIGISAIGVSQFLTLWLVYLAYGTISVLMITLLTSRRLMMGIIDALLLQGLFLALYGIYGYFTKQFGLYDTNIQGLYRIGSVFAAPPTLAFFLSMMIPLSLYRTLTLKGFKQGSGILVTLVLLVALALTFTRAADFSVPVSILVMIFFIPSRKLKAWLLAGITSVGSMGILLASVSNLPLLSRFLSPDVGTLNGRTYLWSALLDHFDPTHLLGYGLNASDILLEQLQVGYGRGVIGTAPHNIFLKALFEHGIIGAALLILLLIALPQTLIARMRKTTADHRLMLAMALAVYINILVQSFFVTVIWSQQVGIYVWILLSLPFVCYWSRHEHAAKRTQTVPQKKLQPVQQEQLTHV